MKLRQLSQDEIQLCQRTVAAQAFYAIVADTLLRRGELSVIRVSDGEKAAIEYAQKWPREAPLLCLDKGFRERFGCEGISCGEILDRIRSAASNCTYFSPSFGFFNPAYDLLPYFNTWDKKIVEGMYQYEWSLQMKKALFAAAGHVCVINRDSTVADKMRNVVTGVRVSYVSLSNWREAPRAWEQAVGIKAPLTLMSAALASKYIGPQLASATQSVVLDIGQAADVWFS